MTSGRNSCCGSRSCCWRSARWRAWWGRRAGTGRTTARRGRRMVGGAERDRLDSQPRRAVRDRVRLRRLSLGVAAGAAHLPLVLAGDRVEVGPEVRRVRVVGDVGHHPRLLAVLDLPAAVAAELAVVALLVD